MNKISVNMFGQLADIAGEKIMIDNAPDTDAVMEQLKRNYPKLQSVKYMIAVDRQIINGNTVLNSESVIALLPPFSGG